MKNYLLFLSLSVFIASFGQDAGIFQTYVIVDDGTDTYYHGGANNDGSSSPFASHAFGNVTQLTLNGGEIKSWKNNGGNVTGAKLYYRVYVSSPAPNPLPNFSELDLPWVEDLPSNEDQKWAKADYAIDILSGLSSSETYTMEVYWKITTSNVGDKLDDNSGSYFASSFTVDSSLDISSFTQKDAVSVLSNKIQFHKTGTYEISAHDLLGRQISHMKQLFNKEEVLALGLKNGLYLIQVKENQQIKNYKMLVR
jgi:hypothetical protein